jgi:3-carboxy-cis,cis-muconate cycloisomerase
MPHKQNPVLSVLVRRAALTAPGLAAQLHLAAADTHDERPDGAWHTEWATLATLSRRVLVAASQTTELLEGLRVHTETMAARVGGAPVLAGTADTIDAVLARVEEEQ